MKGERTTQSAPALPPRIAARFRTRTCSFTILSSSPRCPHLFSSLFLFFLFLLLVLSSFASGGERFQPCGFLGETRRYDRDSVAGGSENIRAILPVCSALHCVTSSFISDFVADLRSEFTKTVSETLSPYFYTFPAFRALVPRVRSL